MTGLIRTPSNKKQYNFGHWFFHLPPYSFWFTQSSYPSSLLLLVHSVLLLQSTSVPFPAWLTQLCDLFGFLFSPEDGGGTFLYKVRSATTYKSTPCKVKKHENHKSNSKNFNWIATHCVGTDETIWDIQKWYGATFLCCLWNKLWCQGRLIMR